MRKPCLSLNHAAFRFRAIIPLQRTKAAALATTRGKTATSGCKAGETGGKAGTTPHRLFLPRKFPSKHPTSGGSPHSARTPKGGETHLRSESQRAEAETNFNDATKDVIEKAEALETHVKTVTMRVDSLATSEVDFFKTLLARHQEAQDNLNVFVACTP